MTLGLISAAPELTPGIGVAAELEKTTFEETDMARSRGGRRVPPRDLLADLTAEEPEATTRAKTPANSQEATPPEALPDLLAELQRIGTQFDALAKRSAELSAGVERSAKAAAGAEEAIGELRSGVDAAVGGTKEARDALSKRLAKIEAAVGELLAVPRAAGEIVEHLKLARSNLVGLSERMEGLERRLPEKLESIEHTVVSVRETAAGLAATGKKLEASADRNAQVLPGMALIATEIGKLKTWSICWNMFLLGCILILCMALHKRFGLFSGLLPGL